MATDGDERADLELMARSDVGSALASCLRCHQPLDWSSMTGGCLRCMIRAAAADDAQDLDAGGAVEELRRYSHFEIALRADGSLDELGHGAMGTTYRAVDTVLHSPVALKVIGRNVADSPAVRARFLREARVAAQLRHPNVAGVFHYGEQQGECFYVMELVDGETLEARVRRDGPLPPEVVLEIGLQVACALTAAESQGLVHRDLKPSNIMWVANPHLNRPGDPLLIKVIDFGLAKALTGEAGTLGENDTRHGFTGTPAYASPEQFARGDQTVDTRSDLYSLGVTLWYLLCGRTPFRGGTLEEIHRQQTREPLPVDQLIARRVPGSVIALLRSLLAVDVRQRPQSVREVIEAIHRCRGKSRRPRPAGWIWSGVVTMALLALGTMAIPLLREQAQRAGASRHPVDLADRSVALLPFENRSPDPDVAFFTGGIQDAITHELARIAQLKVVTLTAGDATLYPPGKRDLAKIARELAVSHLVEGSVQREGNEWQITVKMTDARRPASSWSKHYSGRLADVFAVQSEITRELADRLRATLSASEKAVLDEPPTTDPVAYDLYLRACQGPEFWKGPNELRRALAHAIALLNEAVARDPGFAAAYCKLAEKHDSFAMASDGATADELAVDHRTLAEAALQNARRLQPDSGLVHLAQGTHFALAAHDNEQARIELDLARRTLPNNPDLERIAGNLARNQGRWDDAVHALTKSASLQPHNPDVFYDLALLERCRRNYADADRALVRLMALQPDDLYDSLWRAAGAVEERADLAPLRAVLASVAAADETDAAHRARFSLTLALCEHDPQGVSRVLAGTKEQQFALFGFTYPRAWFEALAARMQGDASQARTSFDAARVEMETLLQGRPANARALGLIAMIDAGLGHKDEAVREGLRACELLPLKKSAAGAAVVGCQLAVVYAWTDQPKLAMDLLEDLSTRAAGPNLLFQPTYGDLRLNPCWSPLHGDPRFEALVARLAPKSPR